MGIEGIDLSRVPSHVGCVMDGNGRWARQHGLARTEGHAAGEESILDAVFGGLDIGISWMSMYAFSTENWRRPADEVRYLMGFNESILRRHRDQLNEAGVRIVFSGRRDWRVPRRLLRHMDDSVALTAKNRTLTLNICFNYGGRAEIVDAVRSLVQSGIDPKRIDERQIRAHMYHPDMPDPDLVIRTSNEFRISNFLLWEIAYSELVFMDVLWPDFRREHLFDAVRSFQEPGPPLRRGQTMNNDATKEPVSNASWLWNHIGRISGTILALMAFAGIAFLAAIGSKSALGLLVVIVMFFVTITVGGRIRGGR